MRKFFQKLVPKKHETVKTTCGLSTVFVEKEKSSNLKKIREKIVEFDLCWILQPSLKVYYEERKS